MLWDAPEMLHEWSRDAPGMLRGALAAGTAGVASRAPREFGAEPGAASPRERPQIPALAVLQPDKHGLSSPWAPPAGTEPLGFSCYPL